MTDKYTEVLDRLTASDQVFAFQEELHKSGITYREFINAPKTLTAFFEFGLLFPEWEFIVFNDEDEVLDYKMAACCNAIPGDAIFGFLTVVDGIKVHRSDCPNSIQLRSNYAYRILQAKWISKGEIDFIASINIKGIDSVGVMNKVTQIISNQMHVNIKSINMTSDDGIFDGIITLKVHNVTFLKELTTKLKRIDAISSITRTYKHN